MREPTPRTELSGLALIGSAVLLVTATFVGYFAGTWLDDRLGTRPWLAIIGLLFGTLIGFYDLYRVGMQIMRRQPAPPPLPPEEENIENFPAGEGDRD